MTTAYPGALDAFTNPTTVDALNSVTVPHATQHANLNDAVTAIETELGTNPKGSSASVKARLDAINPAAGQVQGTSRGFFGASALAQTAVATNPMVVAKDSGSTFVQVATINANSSGSADFAAYSDNGTDAAGWVDMGFTGSGFNDPAYTLTGPNEGYVLAQGVSGTGTGNLALATGSNGSANDIVFATGGFATANEQARLLNSTGQLRVKGLLAQAGTTTRAPLVMTSGTSLTTPAAGSVEYDGVNFYATPTSGTGRTVIDSFGYFAVGATPIALTSATGAQSAFGKAYTVQASTAYQFEIVLNLTLGTTTTRTTGFSIGGTATLTSGYYNALTVVNATGASTAPTMAFTSTVATNLNLNATSTTAGLTTRITGVLRVNAGGTIIPQITFSAAPGGTNQVNTNSFMFIRPIGTSTATSVGAWA
jgi:hypothetical protein